MRILHGGLLTATLLLAAASSVTATVAPPPVVWANPGPMPGNGIILISAGAQAADISVSVSRNGELVDGTVSDQGMYVGFRAAQELSPGTYEVSVARNERNELEFSVEVVSAYQPASHTLSFSLSVATEFAPFGQQACCEPDPQSRSLEHGCFYTEDVEHRTLGWTVTSPLPDAHALQFLYRVTGTPAQDSGIHAAFQAYDAFREASGRYFPIAEQALEYCLTAETKSLIDDSVYITEVCVADPGTTLAHRPRVNFDTAFNVQSCPLPPVGLDALWCEQLWGECDYELQFLSESARTTRVEQCEGYLSLCETSASTHGKSPTQDSGVAVMRSGPPNGCSVVRVASASPTPGWLPLAVLLTTLGRLWRRRNAGFSESRGSAWSSLQ